MFPDVRCIIRTSGILSLSLTCQALPSVSRSRMPTCTAHEFVPEMTSWVAPHRLDQGSSIRWLILHQQPRRSSADPTLTGAIAGIGPLALGSLGLALGMAMNVSPGWTRRLAR